MLSSWGRRAARSWCRLRFWVRQGAKSKFLKRLESPRPAEPIGERERTVISFFYNLIIGQRNNVRLAQ